MTKIEKFKQELNCVFDDDLHTKQWHNIADWIIISLIILSSVEVFLSTFESITEQIGSVLKFIDYFTITFFTIEVSLRIWCADLLSPKYKGFMGRVRYCFSFYGLIDIISTYPFYLSLFVKIPTAALKIFRVARLLRIFRYMKSFKILEEAISSKKHELGISIAFLGIVTVILSFLLYYAEHDAQPELCENGWQTLVWAFAKYLGDPGKIADFPLVTFWGHFIAALVGILGIAIFAVPAGLIGSGFVEILDEKKHQKNIRENTERIRHSFRWDKDQQYTNLFYVPPFQPIDYMLVRQYLTQEEVVDVARESDIFHLYNTAKAYNTEDQVADRVVVVCTPEFNRSYGVCIDRGSKVTIVSTSSYTEPLTGWFAYHLAKIGGFNYISKEKEVDIDNPVSFYNITDPNANEDLVEYLADINALSASENSWVIPVCFATGPKTREHSVHFCYSPERHDNGYDNPGIILEDTQTFDACAKEMKDVMEAKFSLKTDCNEYYMASKNNVAHYINCKNCFAFRLEGKDFYFPANKVAKIKVIADIFNKHLEPGVAKQLPPEMVERPKNCYGFSDYKA